MANYYSYNTNQVQADINMDNAIKDIQNQLLNIPTDTQLGQKANQSDLDITNENVATNTTSLADSANKINGTFINAKYPPAPLVACKGDGTTDDTSAINGIINYAITNHIPMFFPTGDYKITSTIQVNTRGLHFIGTFYAAKQNDSEGTTFYYYGTGAMFQFGTDDGLAYDSSTDYNGMQDQMFENIRMVAGNQTTALNNATGNYMPNSTAIKDWRGGGIIFKNVMITQFDYGFWGVKSDVNYWENVIISYCHSAGVYLGPRSDQFTCNSLYAFNNDTAIVVDGASGARFNDSQIVANGSSTTPVINISSITTSKISNNTVFDNCWFENYVISGVPSFIDVGITGSTAQGMVTINNPLFGTTTTNTTSFMRLQNAQNIMLQNPGNPSAGTFTSFIKYLGQTGQTTYLGLINSFNAPNGLTTNFIDSSGSSGGSIRVASFTNEFGIPTIYGNYQNRVDMQLGSANVNFYGNYGFTGLNINHSSFSSLFLQFRRRIFYGTAVPTGTSVTYSAGDICYNQTPTKTIGWVCVTGGAPGTWVPFGNLTVQNSSVANITNGTIIQTSGLSISRVTETANVTGISLSAGSYSGEEITIINEGSFSITFDVSGNSHIAEGTSCVINPLSARKFVYDTTSALWYGMH